MAAETSQTAGATGITLEQFWRFLAQIPDVRGVPIKNGPIIDHTREMVIDAIFPPQPVDQAFVELLKELAAATPPRRKGFTVQQDLQAQTRTVPAQEVTPPLLISPPNLTTEPQLGLQPDQPTIGLDRFEEIFRDFKTPLFNFIFRHIGNREQAEDLFQDVMVKTYRALAGGTQIQAGALPSWLFRIASNTATDALRRRSLIAWLPLSLFNEDRGVGAGLPEGLEGPDDDSVLAQIHQPGYYRYHGSVHTSQEVLTGGYNGARFENGVAERELLQRVLARMERKSALALLLYEHKGLSCGEIAEILKASPSAIKMRLMRAREQFMALYRQETGEAEVGA